MSKDKLTQRNQSDGVAFKLLIFFVIAFSSAVTLIIIVASGLFYFRRVEIEKATHIEREERRIANLSDQVEEIFESVVEQSFDLSRSESLSNYVVAKSEESRSVVVDELSEFLTDSDYYESIRVLDADGLEVVRVNQRGGLIYDVPSSELQDKSSRDYYLNALNLVDGQIYVSQIELNIEGGIVEVPHRAVIKTVSLITSEEGEKYYLVTNYLAEAIFDLFETSQQNFDEEVFLVNGSGHWLKGPTGQVEFGFMAEDGQNSTLQNWSPDLWGEIQQRDRVSLFMPNGLYSSGEISLLEIFLPDNESFMIGKNDLFVTFGEAESSNWHLITFVPSSAIFSDSDLLLRIILISNTLIVLTIIVSTVFVVKSVWRLVAAERTIYDLNNILKTVNKVLRHDLANHLTHIKLSLEMYAENPEDKSALEEISRSAKFGLKTINKMKQLEGLVSIGRELVIVNLVELAEEVGEQFREIEISIKGAGTVKVDNTIESVFKNIISNAIRHGKTKKMDLVFEEEGENILIKFIDYGKGIPEEIKSRLFDEGFTYGENGNSGLGLYIVKRAVERNEGEVWVENTKPSGATFVIKFPKA